MQDCRISIVTPSFNQGQFLEQTILSVLGQRHPNLEYIIVDGLSTDGSVEIISRYERQLAYWVSEPDKGQYDAINKGFMKSSGDIMGWINSDDRLTPWSLSTVTDIFTAYPEIEWITSLYPLSWGEKGDPIACVFTGGFDSQSFFRAANLVGARWHSRFFIQQESTFWRRSLWERAGGKLDETLDLAGDFELWCRFFKLSELYAVNVPIGGFRHHSDQKTANQLQAYIREAEEVLRRYGGAPYGRGESAFRRILSRLFGNRPMGSLPLSVVKILMRYGVLYPVKVVVYDLPRKKWIIATDYVV